MNLINQFKTCLFFTLLCFWGSISVYAYAPSSVADKKITISVPSKYFEMEWYVLEDGTNTWVHEIEDGEWELDNLSWNKNSTYKGTLQLGLSNDYILISATLSNARGGSLTYTLHESEDGGPVEIVDSGSGSFTLSDYDISEIPFNNYFEDDFKSNQVSEALWPLGTAYGITIGLNNGALDLTGTLNDEIDDQRWYAFSASSILSTANDWTVSSSSFAKIDTQNDFLNYQSATGVELRNSKTNGLEFEISIGLTPWGIRSEIYVGDYDNYDSQYHSTGIGGGVLQEGDFRVVNDSSNKTLTTQYLSGSEWETLYELNWETGTLKEIRNNSETQLNNWTSFSSEYALPSMDFVIPHIDQNWNGENIQIFSLSTGDLGVSSFSVTEGAPVSDIAPASLNGVKITSSLTVDGVGTETRIGWIDDEGTYWDKDDEGNGQWYPLGVEYTKTGHAQAENFIGTRNNSYREGVITFVSPSRGTYTFEYWDSEGTNPLVKIADGYGDFTTEPINYEDLPFDRYFWDDFSSPSSSEINWPIHTHNGITNHLHENAFSLSGTISDPSHQNHDVNAHSILSIQKDWVIYGTPVADLSENESLSFQSAVGVDFQIKDGSEEFELSIGLSEEGIFSEINTSARPGKNREMQKNSGSAYGANKFRIINSASEKKISSQYLLDGHWQNVHQLNWETGEYSETDILSGQTSTSQIANWITYQEAYGSPMMDFQLPSIRNSNGEASFLSLQSGDLGFEEFGVSEDLPISIPSSLQNKKMTVTYETESGSSGTNYSYFVDDDTVKVHYLAGTEDAFWDEESYTWSESGNNQVSSSITNSEGRVVTGELNFESEETGTFTLKFYEPSNGELVYQESATGTFSISDFTAEELPVTKGWMWFDHYPWVYSDQEKNWLYFLPSGSKLMVYTVKDEAWREMTE
jgi:hypothetical protein